MSLPLSLIFKFIHLTKAGSFKFSLVLFAGLFLLIDSSLHAQGNLLINPRRIVFEGSKRSMDLNLANTGIDTATYSISVIQIRMTETGGFETITEPDPEQLFADKNLRFFPRSVTLGPNESQVVKVQLTRVNELKPGEYRSHFYFRAIPKAKPLGEIETFKDTTAISVVLTPEFGITIPAILRIGEPTTKISLSDLSLNIVNDTIPNFSIVFNRTGNMSAYGDLAVYHISAQGKETRIGIANGIAIYTPNKSRKFQFNLNSVDGVDYKAGKLKAVFSASSDVKPVKYAEAEINLN
jgi:P pilus assembly chaperone PapD